MIEYMEPIKEKVSKAQNKRQERTIEKPVLQDVVEADIKEKSTTPVFTPEKPAAITMGNNTTAMPAKAEVQNPTGIKVPEVKPLSFSDMLAPAREQAKTDKTDAVKMQKYYALTDALNALGKMGGAAIGGAIGGNALLGAPKTDEYKESRGYINAFEKAKQANDRLRALDEKEFQLMYNDKQKADDRAYQAQQAALNREWQSERDRINREWQAAVAEKDFERQAALKKEMLNLEQSFKLKYQDIENRHNAAMKEISRDIVKMQTGSDRGRTVLFKDKTSASMTNKEYYSMFDFFDGEVVNGRTINKDNFNKFVRENPQLVNAFLADIRGGEDTDVESEETYPSDVEFPIGLHQLSMKPEELEYNNTSASEGNKDYSPEKDPYASYASQSKQL